MPDTTPRLALPYIAPGQAQKEVSHNEALVRIDALLQAVVEGVGPGVPPPSPVVGQCWIVGAAPSGDWAGQADALAVWTDGGWRFVAPTPGMAVWSRLDGLDARYDGAAWQSGVVSAARLEIGGVQVVGPRQPAIAAPAGGSVVDVEARAVISGLLAMLSTHGLTGA